MKSIALIGAGPCGSLLACYLAKRGYTLDVYEKRSEAALKEGQRGRSINLAISERGLLALEKAGLKERILTCSTPIIGRKVHVSHQKEKLYIYGRNDKEVNYSISRKTLNEEILKAASNNPLIRFHWGHQVSNVDLKNTTLEIKNERHETLKLKTDQILAADGASSNVREALTKSSGAKFTVSILDHGYKEILLPKENAENLETHYLHIWPRKEFMLMGLANLDGSFTMTLFMPLKGSLGLEDLKEEEVIYRFFETYFPDILEMFPQVVEKVRENPVSHLTTVQGGPWYYENQLLLLGDAAHAIVPFFGQGVNCGFEDCRLFDELLEKNPLDKGVFKQFYESRKKDTDAILSMAAQNYDEMKHHVAEKDFSFIDSIEKELMRRFHDRYLSRYVLVSYTHHPYSLVQKIGEEQKQLVNQIYERFSDSQTVDWEVATPWIQNCLNRIESLRFSHEQRI